MKTVVALWIACAVVLLAPGIAVADEAKREVPNSRAQIMLSFSPVVERATPAVVNIYTSKVVQARRRMPLFDDPFFQQFFGDRFSMDMPRERVENSLGSGVIINENGLVVTNHHVIEDADDITVVLADRREFQAELVGQDPRTDLAVLRINPDGEKLPYLTLGDSEQAKVGDLVLAIGNPFGMGQTVTSGIVSAVARTGFGVSDFRFFIQTDAAINPGNSGGALIGLDGTLLGVNTAIYSKSGGSMGLGFAIPSNMVRAVVQSILEYGKPVRPWFGAGGSTVTNDMALALGLSRPTGVIIESLFPNGPASRAGLRESDVVLSVNGVEVPDEESLRYRVGTLHVGGDAKMVVFRQGRERTLTVKLEPPPEDPPRNITEMTSATPLRGTTIANLNPAFAEELGVSRFQPGVVVLKVQRGSTAARLGFRTGDRVLEINGTKVPRVANVNTVFERRYETYKVVVERAGRQLVLQARR